MKKLQMKTLLIVTILYIMIMFGLSSVCVQIVDLSILTVNTTEKTLLILIAFATAVRMAMAINNAVTRRSVPTN